MVKLVKRTKNIENIENTWNFKKFDKKIRELRELFEEEFDERICDLFKDVVSKNKKPCRYLYEIQQWHISDSDNDLYREIWPLQTTREIKIDSAKYFYYDIYGLSGKCYNDLKLYCPVLRIPLFKIDTKMTKKYFDCDSLKRFFVVYCEKYGKQRLEEEYFECSGFKLVYSNDNEAYIGLEDTTLIDVAFKLKRCEPTVDLEFEEE